jgi:hypothetical protein
MTCSSWRWHGAGSCAPTAPEQHLYADLSSITTCKCNDMIVDTRGNAYVGDRLRPASSAAGAGASVARPNGNATTLRE